jgi:flagellar motor switch protein FliG
MDRVPIDVVHGVLYEYLETTRAAESLATGGEDVAREILEQAFGPQRAVQIFRRIQTQLHESSGLSKLRKVDPQQLVSMLRSEHPQTIALVLAHLRPEHASAVIGALDESLQTDVAQSIATMGTATPEAVRVVAETLRVRAGAVVASGETAEVVGGVQPLVEIINRASAATERALLEGLDARDPDLAEEVRSRMLTFADIVKLDSRDVQQVLRGIDVTVLSVAMRGSTESVTEVIRANMSERNREILDDEIKNSPPVRMSQVEEARAQIVRAIRDLEAQGTITVLRGDEDDYVY